MNNQEMFDACLEAAKNIVAAEKALFKVEGVMGFNFDVSGGTTSTEFSRKGTSEQQKAYQLPSNLSSIIEQGYLTSGVPADVAGAELNFLRQMLALVPDTLPGLATVISNTNLSPTNFTGAGTLGTIGARNPYSSDWEAQTQGLYERTLDTGRARAASGPDKVRGGQARAGFELADFETNASLNRFGAINEQQQREAGVVTDAINTANAIESARRGISLGAQGQRGSQENDRWRMKLGTSDPLTRIRGNNIAQSTMGAEFLSKPKVTTSDNLTGKGNQSTFNWGAGAGISCCWIFIAAHGGNLPWWVRYCRNHLGTDVTRRGYKKMARWLVPWMEKSRIVRTLVEATMTYPITRYGGYLVHEPGYEDGYVFRPVKRFWFWVWNKLGK